MVIAGSQRAHGALLNGARRALMIGALRAFSTRKALGRTELFSLTAFVT
jgi:hypothetical protein